MTVPITLKDQGVDMTYNAIALLCQTFFFGVYAVMMPLSAYIIVKRGQRSRTIWLIWVVLFMFILSTLFWAASVADLFLRFRAYFVAPSTLLAERLDTYASLANAVILVNCALADGVVVWRAWVICHQDSGRLLYIPIGFLILTSFSVFSTIVIRVILIVRTARGLPSPTLTRVIDCTQVSNIIFTLLTNISATAIIFAKAWKYRRTMRRNIRDAGRRGVKTETVFALLVESGTIYCLLEITVLVAMTIRLPYGTLGDIFVPANIQIGGIYPTAVLVIVGMHLTMKETTFVSDGDESLEFASPGQEQTGTARATNLRFATHSDTYRTRREDDMLFSDRAPQLKTVAAEEKFEAGEILGSEE